MASEVRIFLSSTFCDLQAERSVIVNKIAAALNERYNSRGLIINLVDLRWGVTEEASRNGKVIEICLREIRKSRPYFAAILGGRYGWCPGADEISRNRALFSEYPELKDDIEAGRSITEIEIQYAFLKNGDLESRAMFFLKDILDKLGVNVQLIRHGKYKSAGETFIKNRPSPENMLQNQELLDAIWDNWTSTIAQAREISQEDFNSMIDNLKLNFSEDFLDNGLVDELLTREQLKEKLSDFFDAGTTENVPMVSLTDYAKLKVLPNFKADNKIAVIYANGNIVDGNEPEQVAGDRFASIIADVRKDSTVKAVVFRVSSPGGSVFASEKIKAEIDLLRQDKPVIASYGAYAASGGYWISNSCDYIFTNAGTLTGSIGVFSMIPDFSKTLKDIAHVNITTVSTNRHGDMYSSFRPLDNDEINYMQASVERIYDKFTSIVAEGRDLDKSFVDSIAQGRVWAGSDALELGLVDRIGTIKDAILYAAASAKGDYGQDLANWQIVEYPKPLTTMEKIMQAFGGSEAKIFAGTPFEGIEKAFTDWDATKSGQVYARIPYEIEIK